MTPIIKTIAVIVLLGLSSCGKGDEETSVHLMGFWVNSDGLYGSDEIALILHPNSLAEYGFKKDGKYMWIKNATFGVNDGKLGIKTDGNQDFFVMDIISVNEKELTLKTDNSVIFKSASENKMKELLESQKGSP